MTFVVVCDSCGWKELRFNMTDKMRGDLMRYQVQSKKGLCYKCEGEVSIHQLKFKLIQKIRVRFPDKQVVKTFMEFQDVAMGEGRLVDGCVVVDGE